MKEYIEREAALNQFEDTSSAIPEKWARIRIEEIPAADVRPVVRGKWIELGKYSDGYNWSCSVCKRESVMAVNYCPFCGANMREVEHE